MAKVSVFGRLFPPHGQVQQYVEPPEVGIAGDHSLKLFLLNREQFPNGGEELAEEALLLVADYTLLPSFRGLGEMGDPAHALDKAIRAPDPDFVQSGPRGVPYVVSPTAAADRWRLPDCRCRG
jgi:hypothetical protein